MQRSDIPKGEHPLTDILYHKIQRFSPTVDRLIREIVDFGGKRQLERTFNWYVLPPVPEFEKLLQAMRKRLCVEAKRRRVNFKAD